MRKIIITSIFILSLMSMYYISTNMLKPKEQYDYAIKRDIYPGMDKKIASKLKENNISFKIDSGGFINYKNEDKAKVDKIVETIENDYFSNELPAQTFTSLDDTNYFKRLLEEKGIPYTVRKIDASEAILWENKYDDQVRILIGKVYQKESSKYPPQIRLSNQKEKSMLIERLNKENIEYKIVKNSQTDSEHIEYSWDDFGKVSKIHSEVIQKSEKQ